tara:strand:+ start:2530 stop:10983 length:8454 start_codon:yes stop_codon:yes gene_type:complete
MSKFVLPDGKKINIPSDPAERAELVSAVKSRYGIDLDDTNALTQAFESLKALPRSALTTAISAPEGVAALLDIGDDGSVLKGLRGLKKSIREDSFLAADPLYADTFATKLAEGFGSFAPFLGAGIAGRALSIGSKAIPKPFLGMNLASPAFQAPAALAIPVGMSEQAERIQMARELGEDVGSISETLATSLGGVIGLSELLPITSFLKKVPKTALRNPEMKDKIMQAVKYFGSGAIQEGSQEVLASISQDLVANGLYSDELPIGESVFDEFTIGGIVGGTANLVLKSMAGGKRSVTDSYLKDAEQKFRDLSEKDIKLRKQRYLDAQAQGEIDILQPEETIERPEIPLPLDAGPSPDIDITRTADGKFSLIDLQENKVLDTFENETKAIVEKDKILTEYENKIENNSIDNDLYNLGLIENNTGRVIAKTLKNKNVVQVPLQVLMNYDIAISTARQKQAEEQTKIEQQIAKNSKELLSKNKTRPVEKIQKDNQRLRNKLNKLDTLVSKRATLDGASKRLKSKGLPLKETYTIEEAKQFLTAKDFNQLLKEKADITFRTSENRGEPHLSKPNISNQYIKEVAAMKNIDLNFNDPAVKYAAKQWTGIENIASTKVQGARRVFLSRLHALKPFNKKLPFPDFRPRKHTSEETADFVSKFSDTGATFTLKDIKSDGKNEQFLSDLIYSGRAEQIEGTKNYRLVNNFDFEIARRAEGFDETPTEFKERLEAEGRLPPEIIEEMVAEEEVKQARLLPPSEIEQQQINYAEALELGKTNKFAKEARKILTKAGLKETGVIVSDDILDQSNLQKIDGKFVFSADKTRQLGVEGTYDRDNDIIYIALNSINPDGTASDQEIQNSINKVIDHEMIHALRAKDLIREKEYNYLRSLVKKRKVPETFDSQNAGKTFYQRSMSMNPRFENFNEFEKEEAYVEEAIAELYRARNIKPDVPPKAETIFQKIIQFFKSMGEAFRSSGYQKASDLFSDIESGRVGARARGKVRTLRDIDETRTGLGGFQPYREAQPAYSVKPQEGNKTAISSLQQRAYFLERQLMTESMMPNTRIKLERELFRIKQELESRNSATLPLYSVKVPIGKKELGSSSLSILYNDDVKPVKPNSVNIADLVKELQANAIKAHGKSLDKFTDDNLETIARIIAAEVEAGLNVEGNIQDWYKDSLDRTMANMSVIHPELADNPINEKVFKLAIAITSNGQPVESNLDFGNAIYEGYKETGLFPVKGTGKEAKAMKKGFSSLNALINNYGIEKTLDILETDFTVGQMQRMGFKISGEQVSSILPFSVILGPKIGGAFYQNLIGNFDTVTMDRWFMRTFNRISGQLVDGNPDSLNKNIAILRKSLSRERAESLNIDYDEMQADDDAALEASAKVYNNFQKNKFKNKDKADNKASRAIHNIIGGNVTPKSSQQRTFIRRVMNRAVDILSENGIDTDMASAQAVIWKPEQQLYKKMGARTRNPDDRDYGTISDKLIEEGKYDQESLDRARREYSRRSGLQQSYSQVRSNLEGKEKSKFLKQNVVKEIRRELDRNSRGEDSKKKSTAYTRKAGGITQVTLKNGTKVNPKSIYDFSNNRTASNALKVAGATPINFMELKSEDAKAFSDAMTTAENNSKSSAVYRYSIPEYEKMRMFLSVDGSVGFALKPDGDMVSLFKDASSDIKNASVSSLLLGVEQGGRKLDAFDTVLPDLYSMNGFKVVSRLKWNESQKPDDWNKQDFIEFNRGEPDVVFMVYDPNYYGDYQSNDGQLVEDYGDALSIQESNLPSKDILDTPLFTTKRRDSSQGNSSEAIARRRAVKSAEETVKRTPRGSIPHYNTKASDVAIEAAYEFNNDPNAPPPKKVKYSVGVIPQESIREGIERVGSPRNQKSQFEGIMDVIQNPVENIRKLFKNVRSNIVDGYDAIARNQLDGQDTEWYLGIDERTGKQRLNPKTGKAFTQEEAEQTSRAFRLADNNILTRTIARIRLADRARGVFQGMLTTGFITDKVLDKEGLESDSIAVIREMELVDQNNNPTGKYGGLIQFMSPLYQDPAIDKLSIFGYYAKVSRPEQKDPKTGEVKASPITDQDRANLAEIEQLYPEVVAAYNNYQNWNNKLVEFAQKKGILTEEQAKEWIEASSYYPYYRDMAMTDAELETQLTAPTIAGGALPQNPLDIPLKGSDKPINVDPIEAIARNSLSILTASLKNDGTTMLLKSLETMGIAESLGTSSNLTNRFDKYGKKIPSSEFNVVHAYEDGQKYYYFIRDIELFNALSTVGGTSTSELTRWVGMPATLLRDTVTRDPGFIVVNILRDTLSAGVTSGAMRSPLGGVDEGYLPVIDSFKNMFGDISDLEKFGVVGGYDFSNDEGSVKQFVERTMRRQGLAKNGGMKPQDAFFKIWDGLGELTTKSDGATRKAVYETVYKHMKKNGATEGEAQSEAAYQALEVINFGRRGLSTNFKVVTAAIPFLNARIQGLDVLYRSFVKGEYSAIDRIKSDETREELRGRIVRGAILRGLSLAVLTGLYYMMVSDTDEYKGVRREVRDDYWIIPTGTDFPIRIPIPFEVGAIFKVLPERLMDIAMGDDAFTRKSIGEARTSLSRQLGTSLSIPFFQPAFGIQAMKPLLEVINNRNSFTDSEIIPYYQTKLDPRAQSTERTNELARILGEALNISPTQIDYVMRGYTGTLGGYLLAMADTGTRMITGTPVLPNNVELSRLPLLRRLTFDSKKAGGLQQQFYELRGEVDKVVQTINKLNTDGRADEAVAYRSNMQGVLNVKGQVRSMERYLANWRKRRKRLLQRDDISITVRSDMLRDMEIERDRRLAMIPELRKQANIPVASFGL